MASRAVKVVMMMGGSIPWYLRGGVSAVNCLAVYQPKGAASLSASYINLAHPGTYDLTTTAAPDWTASGGWWFGGADVLKTGINGATINYTVIMKFSNLDFVQWDILLGVETGLTVVIGANPTNYLGGTNTIGSGVIAFSNRKYYLNGVAISDPQADSEDVPANDLYIGAYHEAAGNANNYSRYSCEAVAIYNISLTDAQILTISNAMAASDLTDNALLITFDDGASSVYDIAYPIMTTYGVKSTSYIVSDLIGGVGSMTAANLQTMSAAGHDMANHSKTHVNFNTLNQAQAEAEITGCKDALDALGLNRASDQFAFPYGSVGTFGLAAMTATGTKTGRLVRRGAAPYEQLHYGATPLQLCIRYITNTTTLGEAQTLVDTLKNSHTVLILLFHRIVPGDPASDEWSTANFTALMAYIQSRGVSTLTISEWYARFLELYP